ncbi:hypothetical protein P280DRAFT_3039 [Massarina eburnea CBS 473.64]|uniref:Uncharacterized protein n=1 Tax=Massarina eburnea CBS 473.64 TaxID=1395130 RepID=A0A6A6SE31_9PLEO|nr:hypothetical protein P280DRAFT_3039 [Massarina eburnea CBS 473.64]
MRCPRPQSSACRKERNATYEWGRCPPVPASKRLQLAGWAVYCVMLYSMAWHGKAWQGMASCRDCSPLLAAHREWPWGYVGEVR